jgi:hypothetical protein
VSTGEPAPRPAESPARQDPAEGSEGSGVEIGMGEPNSFEPEDDPDVAPDAEQG